MTSKYQILSILSRSDCAVSGEDMAKEIGISRTAVWKAIQSLEKEGAVIEPLPQVGYRLIRLPSNLSEDSLRLLLQPLLQDLTIRVEKELPSTNSLAKQILELDRPEHILVAAHKQTSGRGRLGRSFFSPTGGIYFSYGWKAHSDFTDHSLLTITVGLATCQALEELYGLDCRIKWVNDLQLDGKKVAGILTETTTNIETRTLDSIIFGIGINVLMPEGGFPEDIQDTAGSLFKELPEDFNYNIFLAKILEHFIDLYEHKRDRIIPGYRSRCSTVGQEISYSRKNQICRGKAVDIDEEGSLVIETEDNRIEHLRYGEVQILKKEAR